MVTHLNTLVLLYSWNNNIPCRWTEYRPKHVGEEIVNKTHHKYWSAFVDYLYILDLLSLLYISLLALFFFTFFSMKTVKELHLTFGFHSFEPPVKVLEHYMFPCKRREDVTQLFISRSIHIYTHTNVCIYVSVCICMYIGLYTVCLKKVQSNLYHVFRRTKENISIWD